MRSKHYVSDEQSYRNYENRRSEFFKFIGVVSDKDNIKKYNRLKAIGYTSKEMERMF